MPIDQPSRVNVIHVVSRIELKQLLTSICTYDAAVGFRYRLSYDMWRPDFMRVNQLTERGVMLETDHGSRLLFIPDLSAIAQFELDNSWLQFGADQHYNVLPELAYTPVRIKLRTGFRILE